MPSSKAAPLSFIDLNELREQLNFTINDIYSKLDYALQLDGKGTIISLAFGGLGQDVSGLDGLLRITAGAVQALGIGSGLSVAGGNLLAASWPVGSIYIGLTVTNPASLLGVGTWAAFGTGRIVLDVDTGSSENESSTVSVFLWKRTA